MKKTNAIPAVVSKRNEFLPAEELVENALPYLPGQFKHPDFRAWLTRYTETVIRSVASHFGVAATRGIEQAAELLCDQDFYATVRERRKRRRQQMQEQIAKQEWERIERQNCPTAEQIAQQIKWSEDQIAYHRNQLAKCEENLEHLRAMTPKNIRLVPSKSIQ
jgi:hypothetical protein